MSVRNDTTQSVLSLGSKLDLDWTKNLWFLTVYLHICHNSQTCEAKRKQNSLTQVSSALHRQPHFLKLMQVILVFTRNAEMILSSSVTIFSKQISTEEIIRYPYCLAGENFKICCHSLNVENPIPSALIKSGLIS